MELIDRKQYKSRSLINNKFFVSRNNKSEKVYFLFTLNNILDDKQIIFQTKNQYYFYVPTDERTKCYCYNGDEKFILDVNDKLYKISTNEFLNIFRKFVEYDNKDKNSINNLGFE